MTDTNNMSTNEFIRSLDEDQLTALKNTMKDTLSNRAFLETLDRDELIELILKERAAGELTQDNPLGFPVHPNSALAAMGAAPKDAWVARAKTVGGWEYAFIIGIVLIIVWGFVSLTS